ncbi:MAG: RluA family pseudouridine synthase [Bacteroidales bacterium]|nr:RluA family pseudouridine synthase [Bacteroidales bacterium]
MSDLNEHTEESGELFEHYRFVVDNGQAPLRIDKYLLAKLADASRNRVQHAAKAGNILVNEQPVKSNYKVRPRDIISIVLAYPPKDTEIYPEKIAVDIVYEDKDILVVNKEAGMVVHPGHGNFSGTLLNALVYYFQNTQENIAIDAKPYLAHRIDKDTTGILLIAKNELAQSKLAKQFFDHTIERTYLALVWGDVSQDEGAITGNIGRSVRDRTVMAIFDDEEVGRHAVTHYRVVERFGYVTLVECRLETGRTHQIRAHLKHIGHPLFNDAKYGGDQILKGTTFTKYKQFIQNCFSLMPRQALHAKSLGFVHPATRKPMHFDSEMPEDFQGVVNKWRKYTSSPLPTSPQGEE